MKIFVTGGNGFIGSRVVRLLLNQGYQVKALLRKTSKTDRIDPLPYEKWYGDVRDLHSLESGMQDCQGVIHLASFSNWNDINSPQMTQVVIQGSKNVFEAAKNKGNLPIVYVSSSTAINGTALPLMQNEKASFNLKKKKYSYAWAKNQVEQLCQLLVQQGQKIVIVNPAEVYGPQDTDLITCGNLLDFAKSNPVLVCSGGTSVVHVEDVAKGIIAAFEKGKAGERYVLGGDNLTIKELAELTLSILNHQKKIITLNNQLILFVAAIGKLWRKIVPFNPYVIPYATKYWFFDNQKSKQELGISFRSATETLSETLQWMKDNKLILEEKI